MPKKHFFSLLTATIKILAAANSSSVDTLIRTEPTDKSPSKFVSLVISTKYSSSLSLNVILKGEGEPDANVPATNPASDNTTPLPNS